MSALTVAIMGHRPGNLGGPEMPIKKELKEEILQELLNLWDGASTLCLLTDMTRGANQLFCEVGFSLRKKHPELVRIIAMLPFHDQDVTWSTVESNRFHKLLEEVDEVTYANDGGFDTDKLYVCGEKIVDRADALIAVWNGSTGVIQRCVERAAQKDMPIRLIDPNDYLGAKTKNRKEAEK